MVNPDRSPASVRHLSCSLTSAQIAFPDLRIGQLISNVLLWARKENLYNGDLFYVENEVLAVLIDSYVEAHLEYVEGRT